MRCPDCMRFASMETEVEESSIELEIGSISDTGASIDSITGIVHVSRMCCECGLELKSYDFDLDLCDVTIEGAPVTEEEWTNITATAELSAEELGGGRYAKNMIGFCGTVTVNLNDRVLAIVKVQDHVSASSFEECV